MKTKWLAFVFSLSIIILNGAFTKASVKQDTVVYTREDSVLTEKILSQSADRQKIPVAELVAEIGKSFLGTPYMARTLENGPEEKLVINLRELDCTTFAENCLALALTIKSEKPGFEQFTRELERIRYRDGKRNGYPSRLHYFSDWIDDNEQKGLVSQPAVRFGSPLRQKINFMSSHPGSYPVLAAHPELVAAMAGQERTISARDHYFLKKEAVGPNEDKLQEGDIVGLTTSVPGLDVTHVGILVRQNGQIHLLHASSARGKVVISEEPLEELLMNKKTCIGIMIARPG